MRRLAEGQEPGLRAGELGFVLALAAAAFSARRRRAGGNSAPAPRRSFAAMVTRVTSGLYRSSSAPIVPFSISSERRSARRSARLATSLISDIPAIPLSFEKAHLYA